MLPITEPLVMFMDQTKYQQHSTSRSQYAANASATVGSFATPYGQFEIENVDIPKHICPVCNKTFRASSLLDIHMRVHVGAKPFVCPVCNHRATQKGNLKLHMKKHHGLDLPTHIDLIPDSGIWGNFSHNGSIDDMQAQLSKKKTALAHSSLLNEEVVELIKKCQNNIGQSTMGRITESLKDFLDMAQQKLQSDDGNLAKKLYKRVENANSNNNGVKTYSSPQTPTSVSFRENHPLEEQLNDAASSSEGPQKNYCYCKICGWKTTSAGYLNVHMRKHKAESHVCTICGRGFKETWYLKNHMRSHIHSLTSEVNSLKTENNLSADLKSSESPKNELENEQLIHELNNKKADCFMCLTCGLVFPKLAFEEHKNTCGLVSSNRDERCKICDSNDDTLKEVFVNSLGLISKPSSAQSPKHVKNFDAVLGSFLVNFKCAAASEQMKVNDSPINSLKKEIEDSIEQHGMHATKRSFMELMKNPAFKSLITSSHIDSIWKLFKSKPDFPTAPTKSNDRTALQGSLPEKRYRSAAMQSLANIGKSLPATKTESVDEPTLDSAFEEDHAGQGYQCHFCSKWFKYRSVLGIHMRSHTGERPYKCSFCDYAGTQHNCLKLHMQRHHPEECNFNVNSAKECSSAETNADIEQEHMLLGQAAKFNPVKCPICSRVSPSPGYLKIHMRSHKQTLDHVCHICGRGFKEYWYLATHLRTHDQDLASGPVQLKEKSDHLFQINPSTTLPGSSVNLSLSKQQSLPTSLHSSFARKTSSSWSPLDENEEQGSLNQGARTPSQGSEPPRQHVSKRKAFQPSRYRAEPYPTDDSSSRSRKSKPRKLSNGNYLAPVFQKLSPIQDTTDDKVRLILLIVKISLVFAVLVRLFKTNVGNF